MEKETFWSLDEIKEINPAESGQETSFLEHLLKISATSENILCHAAGELESYGHPYVFCFAQLPFVVNVENKKFSVNCARDGLRAELRFEKKSGFIDEHGAIKTGLLTRDLSNNSHRRKRNVNFTQVYGLMPLWEKRAELHKAYVNCLTPSGLKNEEIGKIKGWMELPAAKIADPKRRFAPLTAQAFQAEVARRVMPEFHQAIRNFVDAYSVANLEKLPSVDTLYSYHIMIAPGRLACAAIPIPVIDGLLIDELEGENAGPDHTRLERFLGKDFPKSDRVLTQIMAMHKLLKQGEAELALIGCATAIEWFLNDKFSDDLINNGQPVNISASINHFFGKHKSLGLLNFLSKSEIDGLKALAKARNLVVHGSLPTRSWGAPTSIARESVIEPSSIREYLYLAIDVYRSVNLQVSV